MYLFYSIYLAYSEINKDKSIESKIYNINECLSFIILMLNHASNTFQIKLWRKCILAFLRRFSSPLDPEIGKLFVFIQEKFVKRIFPEYQSDMINSDKIWDLSVDFRDINERKCMVELRELIHLIYQDLYEKLDK